MILMIQIVLFQNSRVLDEHITVIYTSSTSRTQKERSSLEKINEDECIEY